MGVASPRSDTRAGVTPPFRQRALEFASPLLERCSFPAAGTPLPCAVSGGADSLALLILAVVSGCGARAYHLDHGFRAGSEKDVEVVEEVAGQLGVEVYAERVNLSPGPNLEGAGARGATSVLAGGDSHRPHRRRPGRDGAPQPPSRRRDRWPRGDAGRPDTSDPRTAAGADPGLVCVARTAPGGGPDESRSHVPPQPGSSRARSVALRSCRP